jgi:hypothetical protein
MRPLAVLFCLAAIPALALEPQAYSCTVTEFLDDSRYPADEAAIAQFAAMTISLVDTGESIVVETTLSGEAMDSSSLPVVERTADRVVAEVRGPDEYGQHTLTLEQTAADITGTLVYRTYETDHRWWFGCEVMGGRG